MILSHKIQLQPNKEQEIGFEKACGCARFAYNWGLNKWNEMYNEWKEDNTKEKPNANLIKKKFNKIKEVEFPWIYESPKDSNQQAFTNLGYAFINFFKKNAKYPKFKKKFIHDSFYISNDQFKINEKYIYIPHIGYVKLTETLRFNGKIMSATVSRHANKWFVSISVELENYSRPRTNNNQIGIDFGIKTLLTDNNGNQIDSPKPLKTQLEKLKREHQSLSRKIKGSNNRKKQKIKLAKLHKRISDIRQDFSHKLTTKLCQENQLIITETLNVKSWMKLNGLSSSDNCIGEIIRQLKYKSIIFNTQFHQIDKWYPSSQLCRICGDMKNITLKYRIYKCDKCGHNEDRDINAAKNIYTAGLAEIKACGHESSDIRSDFNIKIRDRSKKIDLLKSDGKISFVNT